MNAKVDDVIACNSCGHEWRITSEWIRACRTRYLWSRNVFGWLGRAEVQRLVCGECGQKSPTVIEARKYEPPPFIPTVYVAEGCRCGGNNDKCAWCFGTGEKQEA